MQKLIHYSSYYTKLKKNFNNFFIINCDGSILKTELIYKQKNIFLTIDRYKLIKHCYKYNKKKEEQKKKNN